MVRKDFYITRNQINLISKIAKNKGITFSEFMRRIMDDYLEKEMEKDE